MPPISAWAATSPPGRRRTGASRRSWRSCWAALTGAGLGMVFGWLAIRRQGIYFAMITLALAQMIYFFCLQAPFTGGEDGIQQVPRGALFGVISLRPDMAMYCASSPSCSWSSSC